MSIDWAESDVDVLGPIIRARGVESDLGNAELVAYAAAAREEIAQRLGTGDATVRRHDGGQRYIFLNPPIGTLDTVTENDDELVEDTDFRIGGGGAYIERLRDGFPAYFGPWVVTTYDSTVGGDRYDRVVIDLIKLALEYSGLDSRRDGDYAEESKGARGGGGQHNYQMERDLLISELVSVGVGFA
jgi:hypothetical protein